MKKLLLTLAVLLGLVSTAYAQEVLNPVGFWADNQGYTDTKTSTGKFLETTWKIYGFNNQNNTWDHIRCGSKSAASTAYIQSVNAVDVPVSKFVVKISATTSNLTSAKLYVSASSDFTNAYTITHPTPSTLGDWTFEIPDAQQGTRFYKFEFVCTKASGNGFVHLDKIEAYTAADTRTKATLSFPEDAYRIGVTEDFEAPAVNCDVEAAKAEIVYSSSDEAVATVDNTGAVTILGIGSTTITASITDSENYYNASASYNLTVYDPTFFTINIPELGYSNGQELPEYKAHNVTFTYSAGTNTNAPKYYNSGTEARFYANNILTITADEGYVLKMVQLQDANEKEVTADKITVTNGTWNGKGTWTPANRFVNSFVMTNGGTSQVKFVNITFSVVALDDLTPEEYNNAAFKDYEIQSNEEIPFTFPAYAPDVTFTSSDEDVAVYEDGKILPKGVGEATFTVSWEEGKGWAAGEKTFKVTVVSALEDPEFEIVGEDYIVVSEEDDLEIEFVYNGVANPQFTIVSSNPAVATATKADGESKFVIDILKRGTTKFTVTVAGDETYDKATIEFTVKICFKDLATILENAVEGEEYTGVFPVTLVYENNAYNYVTDGTAWALFYVSEDIESHIHGAGAVIPAGWTATYTIYNGLPEFTNIHHDAEIVDHESVKTLIKEYNEGYITTDMANMVVILNDVDFSEATPSAAATNCYGTFSSIEYTFRNQFALESVEAGVYNVKAVVGEYKSKSMTTPTVQLYPIEYMAQAATTAPEATIRTYAHGEAIEFEGLEEGAHILYRHGGEDPDHNNIFTEAAQAAPRKAAPNTEWTYNHTTHPLTFEQGQAMNVKYMAKKAGKAPSAVKSLVVAADGTTGIENVGVEAAEAVYYNLQGVRVANPESGIYVRVQGGKAEKVSLK